MAPTVTMVGKVVKKRLVEGRRLLVRVSGWGGRRVWWSRSGSRRAAAVFINIFFIFLSLTYRGENRGGGGRGSLANFPSLTQRVHHIAGNSY